MVVLNIQLFLIKIYVDYIKQFCKVFVKLSFLMSLNPNPKPNPNPNSLI